jgi:hypothetical protein
MGNSSYDSSSSVPKGRSATCVRAVFSQYHDKWSRYCFDPGDLSEHT